MIHGGESAAAVRTDNDLGYEERIGYFGPGAERLIGTTSRPLAAATSGLVICSSIGNEVVKMYRREVLLGRALAARGTVVQRFHYRGTGNSDGDPAAVTFDALRDDALAAAELVRAEVPSGPIGFMGTRFGALVAAAAASELGDAPIVLVEPAVKGAQFFKEGLRALLMQRITGSDGERATSEQLIEQLKREGHLDLLGHPLWRSLYESAVARNLLEELGTRPRRVLFVAMGQGQNVRTSAERSVASWAERGLEVDVRVVGAQETWWYLDERELIEIGERAESGDGSEPGGGDGRRRDEPVGTAGLILEILSWLDETLAPSARSKAAG